MFGLIGVMFLLEQGRRKEYDVEVSREECVYRWSETRSRRDVVRQREREEIRWSYMGTCVMDMRDTARRYKEG